MLIKNQTILDPIEDIEFRSGQKKPGSRGAGSKPGSSDSYARPKINKQGRYGKEALPMNQTITSGFGIGSEIYS